ncbi:MAG: lamin tail domain-containing protein [Myxococcales bacterium]|nr:lamin tail domain-containing protein [Myxococcales bacterium]MCB9524615.1 lamin tail domain-containing protein [Myxococcales bacterium]
MRALPFALLALALTLPACDDSSSGGGGDAAPVDAGGLFTDAEPDMAPDLDDGVQPDEGVITPDATPMDLGDLPDIAERDYGMMNPLPEICTNPPAPPVPTPIDPSPACGRGNTLRITDLRDPRCPEYERLPTQPPGRNVTLRGVVLGVFDDFNFALQDADGGPYSALFVYNQREVPLDNVRPGTVVEVRGQVIEFFTLTELILDEGGLEVLGDGPLPEPVVVANPERIATGGDLAEILESQLIELRGVRVVDTAPDCPRDFGMFLVEGGLRIDDENDFDYVAARGDMLETVRGVLHYSFDETKLFPRGAQDVTAVSCGGVPDKCEAEECSAPEGAAETGELVITEIQSNPRGEDTEREYVELYNPGPNAVNLDGYTVEDCAGHQAALGGRLNAGEYHVIARSRDRDVNGGVRADGGMGELFLPNGYGSVLVFKADRTLVDQVRYGPEMPWPAREPGQALILQSVDADNADGANWRAADQDYGDGGQGTPGRR